MNDASCSTCGTSRTVSVRSVNKKSLNTQDGTTITLSGEQKAVEITHKTECYSIRIATTKSTAEDQRWRNRVLQRAFERLELHEGKLSRAVLRGRGGGNTALLPGACWVTGSPTAMGATRSCASNCYGCNITSLTAVLQDITRRSAAGIPSKRALSGKSSRPGVTLAGCEAFDKGIPHPNQGGSEIVRRHCERQHQAPGGWDGVVWSTYVNC